MGNDHLTEILYEDKDMIVAVKKPGINSEEFPGIIAASRTVPSDKYLAVHRLDTAVGGVMVVAKNKWSAKELSSQILSGDFSKSYLAVVSGRLDEERGTMNDLLYHDKRANKTYVVKSKRNGVREACLNYEVIKTLSIDNAQGKKEDISLVKIELITGRSHQVRVQFASRKHPLYGDGKYGSRFKGNIGLFATKLSLVRPSDSEALSFEKLPSNEVEPWSYFN